MNVYPNGKYFTITTKPGLMRYDTYYDLGTSHIKKDIDVTVASYDYKEGLPVFVAEDEDAVQKWFDKYSEYVIRNNI